jgi:hypothetical protein
MSHTIKVIKMAKINVQFHCLPNELVEFAETCAIEHKLFSVGLVFFPDFKATKIENYSSMQDAEKINRICLSVSEPNLSAKSVLEFSRKNPDCLSLSIGKHDKEGLVESGIGAQTDNKDALKIWRKIVKKFKTLTMEGAWVINPNNNAKEFYKNHRYTEAAKKAAEGGVTIKPMAGWNYFILGQK